MADTVLTELKIHEFDSLAQMSQYESEIGDNDLVFNLDDEVDYVVESQLPTSDNGYTWYRKYKSGWVEQGGIDSTGAGTKTITLPIVMKDNNYIILTATESGTSTHNATVYGRTTTSFTTSKSNTVCFWQVSGVSE